MRFSTVFIAALTLVAPASVSAIKAFSGSKCNGNAGMEVKCDGSCHSFEGRHSFRVLPNAGDHCVTMFEEAGCPNTRFTRRFTFTEQHGQCHNVNTGTGVRSFKCAPNNFCVV